MANRGLECEWPKHGEQDNKHHASCQDRWRVTPNWSVVYLIGHWLPAVEHDWKVYGLSIPYHAASVSGPGTSTQLLIVTTSLVLTISGQLLLETRDLSPQQINLDLGPDVRVLLLLLLHRRSQEIADLGVPVETREPERRVALCKRVDIGAAFNQKQDQVSMTARGGLMQGRASDISMLIDVDAGFDQEPRGLEVIPLGSRMQRVLTVIVRCIYIIEQVSIKRSSLIQAFE
jgi:hypothetical protein